MLLSVYMQIFRYSPLSLRVQCTAILLDRMNLKTGGVSPPPPPPPINLVYTLACVHASMHS